MEKKNRYEGGNENNSTHKGKENSQLPVDLVEDFKEVIVEAKNILKKIDQNFEKEAKEGKRPLKQNLGPENSPKWDLREIFNILGIILTIIAALLAIACYFLGLL